MKNPLLYFLFLFGLGVIITPACNRQNGMEGSPPNERVRPAVKGGTSAAYFTYKNPLTVADTIKTISSSTAAMAQVHETYETTEGLMGMREKHELVVPPGDSIQFKQGGIHIMLMELKRDLREGDSVSLEIEFTRQGLVTKQLPVKSEPR